MGYIGDKAITRAIQILTFHLHGSQPLRQNIQRLGKLPDLVGRADAGLGLVVSVRKRQRSGFHPGQRAGKTIRKKECRHSGEEKRRGAADDQRKHSLRNRIIHAACGCMQQNRAGNGVSVVNGHTHRQRVHAQQAGKLGSVGLFSGKNSGDNLPGVFGQVVIMDRVLFGAAGGDVEIFIHDPHVGQGQFVQKTQIRAIAAHGAPLKRGKRVGDGHSLLLHGHAVDFDRVLPEEHKEYAA
ncbi:hypothetical protein SDC9_69963 [bioreactor metagenome]|uniref:Uncharacterized protein n=1 Tax=bioreactor metagenome TaxID=1076179 RepID=A0A644Y5A3_9ZZZZ